MFGNSNKRSVLSNYSFSLGLNFFKLAAPIIVVPFVYRQIVPIQMGQVNLVIAIMTYFYISGDLGQYIYGLREISMIKNDREKVNIFFTEMFTISLITNILSLLTFYFYVYYFAGDQIPHIYYYIASIQIFSTFFNVEWMFEATENFKFIAIKTIVVRCITIILTLVFVRGNNAPEFYLLFLTGFMLVNNLSSFIIMLKHVKWHKGKINCKKHIKNMIYIFIMINWTMLYFQLDKLIMGHNHNLIGVSYYTLSERIVTLSSSFLFSFIMVVTPRLGDKISTSMPLYLAFMKKILGVIFLFAFPLSFFLFSNSIDILKILGGANYLMAYRVLNVFLFYVILYIFMESAKTNILLLFKKEKIYFFAIIIGGIINLTIKLLWGTLFSDFEIILITLIIVFFILMYISFYCKRYLKVPFLNLHTLKYLLISLPIILLTYLNFNSIFLNIFIKGLIATIYYIGILHLVRDSNYIFLSKTIIAKFKK